MNVKLLRFVALGLATVSLVACQPEGSSSDPSVARDHASRAPWYSTFTSPKRVSINAGQSVTVRLTDTVDSGSAEVGQNVDGVVDHDVTVDGRIAIAAGDRAQGEVVEVRPAKRFGGHSSITVAWHSVEAANGDSVPISGSISAQGRSTTGKDSATIAGSTVGGAILGHLLGGRDGTAAGAIVGGGVGTAVASRRGEEAVLEQGRTVVARVTESREVVPAGRSHLDA